MAALIFYLYKKEFSIHKLLFIGFEIESLDFYLPQIIIYKNHV